MFKFVYAAICAFVFLTAYASAAGLPTGTTPQVTTAVNDGTKTFAWAGGSVSATTLKAGAGRLGSFLATATASGAITCYDNASAGSGTVVGYVPATAVAGSYYTFRIPATNGITCVGASGSPAGTFSYY